MKSFAFVCLAFMYSGMSVPVFGLPARDNSCQKAITSFSEEVVSFAYKRALTFPASTDPGTEHEFIHKLATVESDHIVYIASGADIYRPLMNFPLVGHYHLFDIIGAWLGNNGTSKDFVDELESRLKELPQAKVERISEGFLAGISSEDYNSSWNAKLIDKIERENIDSDILRQPLTYQVRFTSETYGVMEKMFYLHFGSTHNNEHLSSLVNSIPDNQRLIASIQTGTYGTPSAANIEDLLSHSDGQAEVFINLAQEEENSPEELISEFKKFLGSEYRIIVYSNSFHPEYYTKYASWIGISKK